MNSESFDLITQELIKQKQAMELLQNENRELHQRLADLRAGRGIFIEINGQRFALNEASISQISSVESSSSAQQQASPAINDKPTTTIFEVPSAEDTQIISVMENNKKEEVNDNLTFLEEMMINEFSSALASPLTLLQDPINQQQEEQNQEKSEEYQKAVLRRDLMGSYLLD